MSGCGEVRRLSRVLIGLCLLAVLAWGCRRVAVPARSAPAKPEGSGVWFAEGFGSERDETESEAALSRGGFSWVLYPAARIERRPERWVVVRLSPPARPLARVVVSPVIEGGADASAALESKDTRARRGLEEALVLAVKTVLEEERKFGRLGGVHFDLPLKGETLSSCAEVLRRIRPRLPAGLFLSMTLRIPVRPEDRENLRTLAAASDGLVAMVFGENELADPDEADLLGRPWWAGYSPNAVGRWTNRRGEQRGNLSEGFLARLADDPRLEFQHDMEVEERVGYGYLFRARRPILVQGLAFGAGDEVVFRQPFWTDLIRALQRDLTGQHFVRGRVIRLSSRSDSDRIFTLHALNEILLGRSLAPALRVSVEQDSGTVIVSAENAGPMPSVLSRVTNWIEVDLTRPGIRDVRLGGFDRFEIYAPNGHPVSPGRSSRVRFFETLMGPFEKIPPAVIIVRPPMPPSCCRFRYHLLAAAGPEVTTEWRSVGAR